MDLSIFAIQFDINTNGLVHDTCETCGQSFENYCYDLCCLKIPIDLYAGFLVHGWLEIELKQGAYTIVATCHKCIKPYKIDVYDGDETPDLLLDNILKQHNEQTEFEQYKIDNEEFKTKGSDQKRER